MYLDGAFFVQIGVEYFGGESYGRPPLKTCLELYLGECRSCRRHYCKLVSPSMMFCVLFRLKHWRCCVMNPGSWRSELARQRSLR